MFNVTILAFANRNYLVYQNRRPSKTAKNNVN